MTPSGTLLGSVNTLNAEKVAAMLGGALERWEELPAATRAMAPADFAFRHRWELSYPEGGLVLECFKRDLPAAPDRGEPPGASWNRDFFWLSKAEVRGWIPDTVQAGDRLPLPDELANRFARTAAVDNVRGQTIPFAPSEVKEARLVAEVRSVEDGVAALRLEGSTFNEAEGRWLLAESSDWRPRKEVAHGARAVLQGSARFDLAAGRFVDFELVGRALRWGHTENNGRWRDPEPGWFGMVFRLAADRPDKRVAPTFLEFYEADWIVRPPSGSD